MFLDAHDWRQLLIFQGKPCSLRRAFTTNFLLLFILPIGIEAFGWLEGGGPLTHLMDSLAKFLYDLC